MVKLRIPTVKDVCDSRMLSQNIVNGRGGAMGITYHKELLSLDHMPLN